MKLTGCDLGQVALFGSLFPQWLMEELDGRASPVGCEDGPDHVPAVRGMGEETVV